MLSYQSAFSLVLEQATEREAQTISTHTAYGAVLAEACYSPIALPSFNNSAMDGYAIRADKTSLASLEETVWFEKVNTLGAGEQLTQTFEAYQTIEIMTGAPLPKSFDAVVPVENIVIEEKNGIQRVGLKAPLKKGENIRFKGEDIDSGQTLLSKGTRLTHEKIMTLTGLGMKTVTVFRPMHCLVLSTGKELTVEGPAALDYQIYDCNSPFLASRLKERWFAEVTVEHLLTDTDEAFYERLQKVMTGEAMIDMILSTGAVSAGKFDFVPRVLKDLGAEIIFHKVAVRPGKPILFARLPNGTVYFGLPGNPSAVACGMMHFVEPFLRQQYAMKQPKGLIAILDNAVTFKKPLCFFQKGYSYIDESGVSHVEVLPGQASFKISPFLKANCWVKIENAPTVCKKGDKVRIYLMG